VQETGVRNPAFGADTFGLKDLKQVHWNLTEAPLYEHAVANNEAQIVAGGALCARNRPSHRTLPKDKHTVVDALTEKSVWWAGNRKLSPEHFENLYQDIVAHAKGKTLFAQDSLWRRRSEIPNQDARLHRARLALAVHPHAADPSHERSSSKLRAGHDHHRLPSFKPDAKRHGGREGSDTMVAIDFTRKIVLICGSSYCGRDEEVGLHHAEFLSAGAGRDADALLGQCRPHGDSRLFFGLSGTGKTTLSADPHRTLIGDDETGWGPDGIFNFEGGCYAKTVDLSSRKSR
jgi:phosphoenolpyruvate carboxykinase (ATP)